ncbi:MAG: hypothetical protein JO250_18550 [Armatimonadetes bacterium]|nr:hypothetical protein [Armatimonadota bacterium]
MLPHVRTAADLVTSHAAVRDGFLSQALAKTEKATPYVENAQLLWTALQKVERVETLLDLPQFRDDLITAAGFSEKARGHLNKEELDEAVKRVFDTLFAQAGAAFREEILYRYLLTKGDALGGQMRNWTGAVGQQRLASALLDALQPQEVEVVKARQSEKVQRISWSGRRLLFDVRPRLIDKNIDVILLDVAGQDRTEAQLLADPERYLACGELKGGIDPAGADEHWKTAASALDRIRHVFPERCPSLFFVGAAIEASMAREIFARLQDGRLHHAANLTDADQLADLASWLVTL